jgi:hypothetical protein
MAVSGFFDGSAWRIRFAPIQAGDWSFRVKALDRGGKAEWGPSRFSCEESNHRGFARIEGRWLRFSGGTVFFGVGHNNGWQFDLEQPSFVQMVQQGENLLSFWLASPWVQPGWSGMDHRAPIENVAGGIGQYDQTVCAYLDGLVRRAEEAGIYLLPSIWSHGQLRQDGTHPWGEGYWENNAYSGVCAAEDFFKRQVSGTDTPQWRYQKAFYRYLLARWGYSRAIVGWVGLAEIDGTTAWYAEAGVSGNHPQAQAWCAAVRALFAAADPYRRNASGAYPLVTTRTDYYTGFADWSSGEDLRASDTYTQESQDLGISKAIADQTRAMLESRTPSPPVFHAEFGGNLPWATQPRHLHNGIWSGTTAGAALVPMLWCDGGSFPLLTDPTYGSDMRKQLSHLSAFTKGISYIGDAGLAAATLSLNDPNARGWGLLLSDRGFAWVQSTSGSIGGQSLALSLLTSGLYRIRWYDVWTSGSTPIFTQDGCRVESDGVLRVSVPLSSKTDWALTFERTGDLDMTPPSIVARAVILKGRTSPGTIALFVDGVSIPIKADWSWEREIGGLGAVAREIPIQAFDDQGRQASRLVIVNSRLIFFSSY